MEKDLNLNESVPVHVLGDQKLAMIAEWERND